MSKYKCLVTGVGGFLGQYLSSALKDYEVHGMYQTVDHFDKNPDIPRENKHVVDLKRPLQIEALIQKLKPDFVIHLAAKTEVAHSFDNYQEVCEVNFLGTVALAEANRRFNPNLKLFLMASTMETYGHQKNKTPFNEFTPQHPMAPYAVAKLACEHYLKYMKYAYGFPYCILRQTNAYGRTDNDFFVVERIITQMIWDEELNLGDPEPVRNFIYVDDLVELYKTVLEKYELADGQVFTVGPPNGLRIDELVEKIARIMGWSGKINWNTLLDRPGEIYYLNSSHDKATKILGWEPKVDLDEGIKRTIKIWSDQIIVHPENSQP